MLDESRVVRSVEFEPLQHFELGLRVCRRTLLVGRLVGGSRGEPVSAERLELDGIGAAGFGGIDQLQSEIQRPVVVYSCLGNDEYVRHQDFYFMRRAGLPT